MLGAGLLEQVAIAVMVRDLCQEAVEIQWFWLFIEFPVYGLHTICKITANRAFCSFVGCAEYNEAHPIKEICNYSAYLNCCNE